MGEPRRTVGEPPAIQRERRTAHPSSWAPGTRVEVRDRFVHGWAHGFIVESAEQDRPTRYRLRRVSDNTVLPALFGEDDLRRA